MKERWFTPQDLAGLPGMPGTERAVRMRAEKNLHAVRAKARGKGIEIKLSSLPFETQQYLIDRDSRALAKQIDLPLEQSAAAPDQPALPSVAAGTLPVPTATLALPVPAAAGEELTQRQRDINRAREAVIRFVQSFSGSTKGALDWLNAEHAAGRLSVSMAWAVTHCHDKPRPGQKLARKTYYNWLDIKTKRGGLVPLKREEDMSAKAWHAAAVALRQKPQGVDLAWIARQLAEVMGEAAPNYHTVRRFFKHKFSAIDQLNGRHTGSALSAHQFHHRRDTSGLAPFLEVHADGWNTHFTAPHPVTGEFVTYEVWHYHCIATKYVTPPGIGLSENFEVITAGLEKCIRVGGVMAVLQTDSTGSVKNDRFEFDPVASLAERAGFEVKHPKVGNSQANGIAENFNKYLDRRAKELATYQGPKMDSLTLKRVKRITGKMVKAATAEERAQLKREAERMGKGLVFDSHAEAVAWINRVCEEFNDKPHASLPKVADPVTGKRRHMAPREALAQAQADGWQPVKLGDAELVDLFRPHVRKTIQRGAVSPFGGQRYHHADLEHYNGQEVQVAMDIMDWRQVWVKDLDGRLICVADFYEARTPRAISFYEYAIKKRADAQRRRLENKIDQVEERRGGHLVEQAEANAIPAMRVIEGKPDVALALYGDQVAEREAQAEAAAREAATKRPNFLHDYQQYEWLKAHPEAMTEHDHAWMRAYTESPQWRDFYGESQGAEVEAAGVSAN